MGADAETEAEEGPEAAADMSDTRTRTPTRPRGSARCGAHEAPRAIAADAETERPSAELPSKKEKERTARRVVSNPRRSISIARLSPPHHPGLKKRALLGPGSGFINGAVIIWP